MISQIVLLFNFKFGISLGKLIFFDPAFDSEMIFGGCGALIFVIDAQDDYTEALGKLHMTVSKAYKVNPKMNFEVFIHKVDGLLEDPKMERQRAIRQQAVNELTDAKLSNITLSFLYDQYL